MDFLRNMASAFTNALNLEADNGQQERQISYRSQSPQFNVYRTALLLREKLPPELVLMILDFAQCWQIVHEAKALCPDRVGEQQSPKLQTALSVPSYIPRGAIRRVRFITISRDQGWSDYHDHHGTYDNSWTWFEAGVRGLDPGNTEDQETLHEPVNCQHRNALDPEHRRLCMQNVARYRFGSKRIVTNVHAGREFQTHVVEWDASHVDETVRKMLKELKGGHRIEVSAHAQFPGWCNYIERVTIQIECAAIRRL